MDQHHLRRLADRLAADGPNVHHEALREVAAQAIRAGAPDVLAHIVASSDESPVARLRAFDRLVRVLDSPAPRNPAAHRPAA